MLQLFFIHDRDACCDADHAERDGDQDGFRIFSRLLCADHQACRLHERGRYDLGCLREKFRNIRDQNRAARSEQYARAVFGKHGEQNEEANGKDTEEPPMERGGHESDGNAVVPKIGVIGVGDTEAEPIAARPDGKHEKCLCQHDLIAVKPLGQNEDQRSRLVFLGKDAAVEQNEGDQRHRDIFEKLRPRGQRIDRDRRDDHTAFFE